MSCTRNFQRPRALDIGSSNAGATLPVDDGNVTPRSSGQDSIGSYGSFSRTHSQFAAVTIALNSDNSPLVDDGRSTTKSIGRIDLSRPASSLSRQASASMAAKSVLERCRAAAKVEVVKASRNVALSDADAILGKPLESLGGLKGLPPQLIRRCQVMMRAEESLRLAPKPLQEEWSANTLETWTAKSLLSNDSRNLIGNGSRSGTLTVTAHSSKVPECRSRTARNKNSKLESHGRTSKARQSKTTKTTEAVFSLLERWVRVLRPLAPCGTLLLTIVGLVHGADAELPPDPVGAELRRIVPRHDELQDGRWAFLEELMSCLDLEEQFDRTSVMHVETPRRRPMSAPIRRGNVTSTFAQAFKGSESGGMRITAGKYESWTAGQAPRSPRTCEVPGPGFYKDKSLQRAVCNPLSGEFASCGKPRTNCSVNTVSVVSRFGDLDVSRAARAPPSAGGLRRSTSAPGVSDQSDKQSKKLQGISARSTWERLLPT